jgi:copper chaperone CopZ
LKNIDFDKLSLRNFKEFTMTTKTVTVPAINCGHCTNTIETELSELGGVSRVSADKDSKQVIIEWDTPADWDSISALLDEIGFPAA